MYFIFLKFLVVSCIIFKCLFKLNMGFLAFECVIVIMSFLNNLLDWWIMFICLLVIGLKVFG